MEEYSYSRLTRFIDCPLSYMRKYLNAEVPESHGITEGGLFMHNLLEMYERGKIDKDGMIDYFKKNYEKEVTSTCNLQMSENFSKDMYYLYYNGYLNYLENFNGIEDCKKIVDVEKEFHIVYNNDFSITGKIDLVFYNHNDELCVLDHKSKNKFKSKKDQADYARQLYLYAWACKTLYNKYPKYLIFNMLRGEIIYIDFSEEEMNNTLRWFADTVDEIRDTIVFEAHSGNFYCNNFCLLGRCELCDE